MEFGFFFLRRVVVLFRASSSLVETRNTRRQKEFVASSLFESIQRYDCNFSRLFVSTRSFCLSVSLSLPLSLSLSRRLRKRRRNDCHVCDSFAEASWQNARWQRDKSRQTPSESSAFENNRHSERLELADLRNILCFRRLACLSLRFSVWSSTRCQRTCKWSVWSCKQSVANNSRKMVFDGSYYTCLEKRIIRHFASMRCLFTMSLLRSSFVFAKSTKN